MKKIVYFFMFAFILLLSCNDDMSNNEIIESSVDVDEAVKSVKSSEDLSRLFSRFKTKQDFKNAIEVLDKNNLSYLLETAYLDGREGSLVTLETGIVVKKIGEKYYLSDDVELSDQQLAYLSDKSISKKTITISRTDTQEDLCKKMSDMYPGIKFPSYDVMKKVVDENKEKNKNILSRGAALIGLTFTNIWDESNIPYTFHSSFSASNKEIVLKAISHWNSYSGTTTYTLVPRTNQKDYIEFISGEGNSSHVGRKGGKQNITLYKNGFSTGTAIHEIGHAIGLYHEQSKENRNNFINVYFGNIEKGKEHNFERQEVNCAQFDNFDFGSIMLYGSYDFSANGQPTMTKKSDNSVWTAQRSALSSDDVNIIPKMIELSVIATYYYILSGGK